MALWDILSRAFSESEMKTTAAVFMAVFLTVKLVMTFNKKRYKLPPGPRGLPVVGYLPFFSAEPPVKFMELRKTYGDVISIRMGSWPAVVINGMEAITEALVTKKDNFSARPAFTTARLANDGRNLAFSEYGPIWKAHRKLVRNVLTNFSHVRKSPIEYIIRSAAELVVDEFLAHGNSRFCPLVTLQVAASSTMYQLCYGKHRNIREDQDFMILLDGTREFEKFTRSGNPVDVMPWLRYIMPRTISKFIELSKISVMRRKTKVEEHESSFDENNLRDIADGLIHAGNHLSTAEMEVGLDKNRVVETLDVIHGAAEGTMTSSLQWFVGLMSSFPQVQEKVFQEINRVVGQGRDVSLADRPQLPLVEATMYEVLRYGCPIPFTLPHSTTCDTTLQGYDIPEGTVVLVNLYSICKDVKLWGDPEVFRPERFLNKSGQVDRGLMEQVVVFSLGRRRCVGEKLARMEFFLFIATLLQRLKFYNPTEQSEFILQTEFTLNHDLLPFDVCVCPRE